MDLYQNNTLSFPIQVGLYQFLFKFKSQQYKIVLKSNIQVFIVISC